MHLQFPIHDCPSISDYEPDDDCDFSEVPVGQSPGIKIRMPHHISPFSEHSLPFVPIQHKPVVICQQPDTTSERDSPNRERDIPPSTWLRSERDNIPLGERDTIPLGERDTIPLGERDTIPLGERDTIPSSSSLLTAMLRSPDQQQKQAAGRRRTKRQQRKVANLATPTSNIFTLRCNNGAARPRLELPNKIYW